MIELPEFLRPYAKTITAVIVGVIGWAAQVVNSAPTAVTGPEWIGLATVLAAGLGVYTATNQTAP